MNAGIEKAVLFAVALRAAARLPHVDFSMDGCKTKADVDARREFLKMAARHQQRAHHFSDDDLRELRATDADVPPFRLRHYVGLPGRPFYFSV